MTRTAIYDKPMRAIKVTLDKESEDFYRKIGKGNLSKGIRDFRRLVNGRMATDYGKPGGDKTVTVVVAEEIVS